MARKKSGEKNLQVGNIREISGEVTIAGGDIYKGYTAEQVTAMLAQISTTFQAKSFDGRSPYKGLEAFNEEDADLFFGREKWVEDLVGRVKESRTLFITGPSGSGKSSLVRAGLIPALKKESISAGWLYGTLKPGRDSIEAMGNMFSRLKDPGLGKYLRENAGQVSVLHECAESALSERTDQRLVLFVDQFEEVFTQLSKDKAQTFINLLDYAATVENGRVIILFSMRSDFVPNCATSPQLNALLNQQFVQIGAMEPEELVSAIAQPALRVGLKIDPDLIAQIINDMKGEPGALPLMQFALKDLFDAEQAKGGMIALTLSDYLEHGGINQALERHANASLAQLTDYEKELARSVFSGLIEIGRGTQDTRRIALSNELIPAGAQADTVKTVVQKLANARLITTDATTVTISHEKLIDAWPWLRKLVNENRDAIALQNEIVADAKEWEEQKRDPSYLYSGARLATAREKMNEQKLALSGLAQDFVKQSVVLQDAERKARDTLRRRITVGLVSGIAIALALAVFGLAQARLATNNAFEAQVNLSIAETVQVDADNNAATAIANEHEANRQAQISRAGELAALAIQVQDQQPIVSDLLGVEAFRLLDSARTRTVLLNNLNAKAGAIQYLSSDYGTPIQLAYSPDGKILAALYRPVNGSGYIVFWDMETYQMIGQPLSLDASSLAFRPDGKILAAGMGMGYVSLIDAKSLNLLKKTLQQPISPQGYIVSVNQVVFSPDGKTLAAGSGDGVIVLWDSETFQQIGEPLHGATGSLSGFAFSPDSSVLAIGEVDNTITLWDVRTRQQLGSPLQRNSDSKLERIYSVAFSPDGRMLASTGSDHTIKLWDTKSHQLIGEPLRAHNDIISSLAFSIDGKILASGSSDETVILWDTTTRQPIEKPLDGHGGSVTSIAFSPDGKTIVSGSSDTTIILWSIQKQWLVAEPLKGDIGLVTFSPIGGKFATASSSVVVASVINNGMSMITLWELSTRQPIAPPLLAETGFVRSIAFSPDGHILASGNANGTINLWNVDNHELIGQPLQQPSGSFFNSINSVAFSPDGKILASGSQDTTVTLWDVENHKIYGQLPEQNFGTVQIVAFSPNGKILATGSGAIILWDVETLQPIAQPLQAKSGFPNSLTFTRDGKMIVSGYNNGTILIWDIDTLHQIGLPIQPAAGVNGIALSPDSTILAAGASNGTVTLWDLTTHQQLGQSVSFSDWPILSMDFSPDSKILAIVGADDSFLLNLDPQIWIKRTCQRAGRNFTRAEWATYFPNEEYRKTCEQWPLEPEATATP